MEINCKRWSRFSWSFLLLAGLASNMALNAVAATSESGTKDASKKSVETKRDPFWPVGYQPEEKKSEAEVVAKISGEGWSGAMKQIVINGVSSRAGDEYIAVINGEIKNVGESVSVRLGSSVYTWVVDSIKPPSSVKLRRVSVQ